MKILNMVIPILMHFLTFIRQMHSILHKNVSFASNVKLLRQPITSEVTYEPLFLSMKITKKRYVSDFLETVHVYFLLAMYHKYNNISGL